MRGVRPSPRESRADVQHDDAAYAELRRETLVSGDDAQSRTRRTAVFEHFRHHAPDEVHRDRETYACRCTGLRQDSGVDADQLSAAVE